MSSIDEHLQESRVHLVLLGTIIPTALGTLFVAGRLYTRGFITRNWGWDDAWIFVAWILTICVAIANGLFCNYGGGRHIELQSPDDLKPFLILAFASRILYQVSLMTLISTIPLTLIVVLQCDPIAAQWDFSIPVNYCLDPLPGIIAFTACSVFSDAALIVFAVPRVLPLRISKRQKATLVAIVSFGVLVIVAALVRFVRSKPIFTERDHTWDLWEITTWSSVELNTALFCISAPSLRPLLRKIVPDMTWLKTTARKGREDYSGIEARNENDFRMTSRFTVGGYLDSPRLGMGKTERTVRRGRDEWEMGVLGSRNGLSRMTGDEEEMIDLVETNKREEGDLEEREQRESERIRERVRILTSPGGRAEIPASRF
ncbi:hypothetical protein EYC84_005205 [Monilinia fructicola]|uniref:Rhodopsin domain-containing protein n=1 Tax=Monilinia fructicola TaxID=38448 RepID=A0A5M9K0W3_MONFR|nr:hypothetical protein EYC84_005205 [Monilinia fructicola]